MYRVFLCVDVLGAHCERAAGNPAHARCDRLWRVPRGDMPASPSSRTRGRRQPMIAHDRGGRREREPFWRRLPPLPRLRARVEISFCSDLVGLHVRTRLQRGNDARRLPSRVARDLHTDHVRGVGGGLLRGPSPEKSGEGRGASSPVEPGEVRGSGPRTAECVRPRKRTTTRIARSSRQAVEDSRLGQRSGMSPQPRKLAE